MLGWFISFSEFTEFSKSSALFRKNSSGTGCTYSRVFYKLSTIQQYQHCQLHFSCAIINKLDPRSLQTWNIILFYHWYLNSHSDLLTSNGANKEWNCKYIYGNTMLPIMPICLFVNNLSESSENLFVPLKNQALFQHTHLASVNSHHPTTKKRDGRKHNRVFPIWNSVVFTARRRSCGKVMFSQVSVCPQEGGYLFPGDGYVCNQVPSRGGEYVQGWVPTPPNPDMRPWIPQIRSASRRFASYWNAFLLSYANMNLCALKFKCSRIHHLAGLVIRVLYLVHKEL